MFKKTKSSWSEVPTSSLADIAFLLLIFFLVASTISLDRGIGLTLPGTEDTPIKTKNICNLFINSYNEVLIDDAVINPERVAEVAEEKLKQNPNLVVSVKTDRKAKYDTFIQVLDQLKTAKAARISIAEYRK